MLDFSDINFKNLEGSHFDLAGLNELIMPELRARAGAIPSIFEFWFGGLYLVYLDDKKAIFQTSTNIRKNILTSKHVPLLKEVLGEFTGCDVEVAIVSLPELREAAREDTRVNMLIHLDEEAVNEVEEKERRVADYINSSPIKAPEEAKPTLPDISIDELGDTPQVRRLRNTVRRWRRRVRRTLLLLSRARWKRKLALWNIPSTTSLRARRTNSQERRATP